MQQTIDFLQHVLPDEGFYCAWQLEGRRNFFFDKIDALAAFLIERDTVGQTIYHACASYSEKSRRLAEKVHLVASLWLDIDAGEGKPYADATAAMVALFEFCQRTQTPFPTLVGSGGGLHAYWPLAVQLGRRQWLEYATGLRALCHQEGLQIDPARTCDAASILRTPGTHWRKSGVREVVAGTLNGPFELGELEHVWKARTTYANGHVAATSRKPRVAAALGNVYDPQPSYVHAVAGACRQVSRLRETNGNISEPDWYATLEVLAFCTDGDKHAHAWSSGYDGYTHEETQARLNRARNFGPTTCEKFHSLKPEICEACSHWQKITSPIVLGRVLRTLETSQSEPVLRTDNGAFQGNPSVSSAQPIALPEGFQWGQSQELMTIHEGKHGATVCDVVSRSPIYLDRVQASESRNDYSLVFKHHIPSRGWEEIPVKGGDLHTQTGKSVLHDKGANIVDYTAFLRYVQGRQHMLYTEQKVETAFDQFGWKNLGQSFLYGTNLYEAEGVRDVPVSNELRLRCHDDNVGPAKDGSFKGWIECVEPCFMRGAETQGIAIVAAASAPLVYFLETDEGGVIYHWFTGEGGKGKTWSVLGGITFWGRKPGLSSTSDESRVAKQLTLAAVGNLPLVHDEFTMRDPERLRQLISMFTEGIGKNRADRSGRLKHDAQRWQTVMMAASNMSIYDALTKNNRPDPMCRRIIELSSEIPPHIALSQADRWRKKMTANSGHAGHAYMQYIMLPATRVWIAENLEEQRSQLWKTGMFEPDDSFRVRGLASAIIACKILNKIGIEFDWERLMRWLIDQLPRQKGIARSSAADNLAEYLNEFRNTGTLVMAAPWAKGGDHRVFQEAREARIRHELLGKRFIVVQSRFRDWLTQRQQSYTEVVKQLKREKVILRPNMLCTIGAGTESAGAPVYCIEVDGNHAQLQDISAAIEEAVQIRTR